MSMGMDTLRVRWQGWCKRFAALRPREKSLVAAALGVAILFGGYSYWIEPGMQQAARVTKTLSQQQAEQTQLQGQVAALAARNSDPDSANRAALLQLRDQLAVTEREIGTFGNTLVPPRRVPALLQTLLARHRGLTLVSLTTLPPRPLIEPPAAGKDGAKPAEEPANLPGGNLFKHGIEIRLAGNYQDLLAYLAELDASPQKLLRGGIALAVRQYPVSELTLTVYTLSLDSTWLIV
jgi:MSHA biogenesis protein MshJ